MDGSSRAARLHVLHVHAGNMFGGVERILETLACSGRSARMSSSFALCFEGRLSRALAGCRATVTNLGSVRTSRPWQIAGARTHLSSLIERAQPDVVLVHSAWSQALFGPTARRAGRRLIRWLHAPDPGNRWLELAASRVALDRLICNSEYTRDASRNRFPGVPRDVCYAPVSVTAARGADRAAVRAELATREDAVVIVLAARMEEWKGHRTLVDALGTMRDDSRWHCWIAGGAQSPGESTYVEDLRGRIDRLGLASRVQLLGERDDVGRVLAAADVYCQPNDGPEPFGMSFVEALASGLPVVATTLGAVPEIVNDTCGVLVAPGRPDAVASALGGMVGDRERRQRLAQGARARAAVLGDVTRRIDALADALGKS